MSKFLIEQRPLTVQPRLAKALGLERAIILQQVHYACTQPRSGKILEDGENWVWNTYEQWAEEFDGLWKPETLRQHFNALEKAGVLLSCQPEKSNWDRTKYYRVDRDAVEKLTDRTGEPPTPRCGDIPTVRGGEISPDLLYTESSTDSSTEYPPLPSEEVASFALCAEAGGDSKPPAAKTRRSTQAREVFDFWLETMGWRRNTKFEGARQRKIEARLKEGYSVEELKQAVLGCSWDPHFMGDNERGTKYNDIELICRDNVKTDRFLNVYEQHGGQQPQPKQNVTQFPGKQKEPDLMDPDDTSWIRDLTFGDTQLDVMVEARKDPEMDRMYHDPELYERAKEYWRKEYPNRAKKEIESYERSRDFADRFKAPIQNRQ